MKKFEVGKIYCECGYRGKPDYNSRILVKKVTEKFISYVHIADDGYEYVLGGNRKVDIAKIQRWDKETERVHLNIGILGESYLAKYEL